MLTDELLEFISKKPRISPRLCFCSNFCRLSVAIGADSDADTRRADADAGTFVVAAALDIALAARSIAVGIALFADDDTALVTLAPALTGFIADHADVLNVALRGGCCIRGKRCSGSGRHEKDACASCEIDREGFHDVSFKNDVSASQ
jgi:hypothetical protein